jgi:hypothetical protein
MQDFLASECRGFSYMPAAACLSTVTGKQCHHFAMATNPQAPEKDEDEAPAGKRSGYGSSSIIPHLQQQTAEKLPNLETGGGPGSDWDDPGKYKGKDGTFPPLP